MLALTLGDPAGIGLEISLKAYRTAQVPPFVLFGDVDFIAAQAQKLGFTFPIQKVSLHHPFDFYQALPVVSLKAKVESLTPSFRNAPVILESIEAAVHATQQKLTHALVTNPIAKYILAQAGFKHAGHTEFLGELSGSSIKPVMLLWSAQLAVIPITVHMPLKDVPHRLTTALIIESVETAAQDYAYRFNHPAPRLAFCGLNPHASDNGLMGDEEARIITPALDILRARGHHITGLFAADTLFHAAARQTYDLAFGMYHDQVLTPMKTLAFDEGVNVTLGLPFIRTSPDHGTAFAIAGQGLARETSLIEALKLAARLRA
jgi:4-hydroxythreonine-4-phosphate dehydrogenase